MGVKLQYEDQLRLLEHVEQDNILEALLSLTQTSSKVVVNFFNYYKEVPISSAAEILYVFDSTLHCRTNDVQSRAIELCKYVIIKSEKLKHDIYAAASYSAETNEVLLSEFSYVEVLPDKRTSVRVRVSGLVPVTVEAGHDKFQGKLRDLSLCGCLIEVPDRALLGNYTFFQLNLALEIKTRPDLQKTRVMARLLRFENNENPAQCIFLFEHDKRSEDLVSMYITQRQTEIIRELKQ
jgi:hypothetical protein